MVSSLLLVSRDKRACDGEVSSTSLPRRAQARVSYFRRAIARHGTGTPGGYLPDGQRRSTSFCGFP